MVVDHNGWTTGTLKEIPFFRLPALPSIVSEWAGLLPLVIHLANYRHEHRTVGHIALQGQCHVSLFPKLGVLRGLARLIESGPEFVDSASIRGASSKKVWDVQWGSVFPCANGAASEIITQYVLTRRKNDPAVVPATIDQTKNNGPSSTKPRNNPENCDTAVTVFRRRQILHLLRFSRKKPTRRPSQGAIRSLLTKLINLCRQILCIGFAIIVALCGCYGTCLILFIAALNGLLFSFNGVLRSSAYLKNNEEKDDTHMLVATHENANIWFLFSGDRGVVDTLLNKTMFTLPQDKYSAILAQYLRLADGLQLLVMTYAAAQKGWEGIALLLLVIIDAILKFRYSDNALARQWLEEAGIEISIDTFEFTGRSVMLGAVQIYSNSKITRWMDEILVPHPRRDAFLARLEDPDKFDAEQWSTHDLRSIVDLSDLAKTAAKMLQNCHKNFV